MNVQVSATTSERIMQAVAATRGDFAPVCPVCQRWSIEHLGTPAELFRCSKCGFTWSNSMVDSYLVEEYGVAIKDMKAAIKTLIESPLYDDLTSNENKAVLRAMRIMTKQLDRAYRQLAAMMNAIEIPA